MNNKLSLMTLVVLGLLSLSVVSDAIPLKSQNSFNNVIGIPVSDSDSNSDSDSGCGFDIIKRAFHATQQSSNDERKELKDKWVINSDNVQQQDNNNNNHNNNNNRRRALSSSFSTPKYQPVMPHCIVTEGQDFFGFNNNECYLPETMSIYSTFGSNWPTATIKLIFVFSADTSGANPIFNIANLAAVKAKLLSYFSTPIDSKIRFQISIKQINSTTVKNRWNTTPFSLNVNSHVSQLTADYQIPSSTSSTSHSIFVCIVPMGDSLAGLGFPPSEQINSVVTLSDYNLPSIIFIRPDYIITAAQGGASGSDGVALAHEIGHTLTLFHTFQSADTNFYTRSCQLCSPLLNQWDTGDMINDTNPIPNQRSYSHVSCSDTGYGNGLCNGNDFVNPPYLNIMGYNTQTCMTEFTTGQINRMRCSIDRYLRDHSVEGVSAVIPTGVHISIDKRNVSALIIYWTSPITSLSPVSGAGEPNSYTLYRVVNGTVSSWSLTTKQYTDYDVVNGSTYMYYVRPVSTANGMGLNSNTLTIINDGKEDAVQPPNEDSALSVTEIALIAAGSVIVVLIILALVIYACRPSTQQSTSSSHGRKSDTIQLAQSYSHSTPPSYPPPQYTR